MAITAPIVTSCDWYDLPCNLSTFSDWLLGIVKWIPEHVAKVVLDGLATIIESIPALDVGITWTANAATAFANAGYVAHAFALPEGIGMIATALLARFFLRRIPLIG